MSGGQRRRRGAERHVLCTPGGHGFINEQFAFAKFANAGNFEKRGAGVFAPKGQKPKT